MDKQELTKKVRAELLAESVKQEIVAKISDDLLGDKEFMDAYRMQFADAFIAGFKAGLRAEGEERERLLKTVQGEVNDGQDSIEPGAG